MPPTVCTDNILWLGAKELLAHFGRTPDVLCTGSQLDYTQPGFLQCPEPRELLNKLGDSAMILWHAGGNFGDIWRHVQLYR